MRRKYAVLSIDGGGIRGILPAVLLSYIEQELQRLSNNKNARISDYFDFFAGTSTGAILTSALLLPNSQNKPNYSATDLVAIYQDNCQNIFNISFLANIKSASGILDKKYTTDGFNDVLVKYFDKTQLKELLKPCLIPAYNLSTAQNYFFCQHKALLQDNYNFLVSDACLAACAAPSYFAPSAIKSISGVNDCFIDGGVFAMNPTLCAYSEVRKLYTDISSDDMLVLSIGTGKQTQNYSCPQTEHWGAMEWRDPISNIISSSSSDVIDFNMAKIFNTKDNYLRIQPNIDTKYFSNMDNCNEDYIQYLVDFAHRSIERYKPKLDIFINKLLTNNHNLEYKKSNKNCIDILDTTTNKYPQQTAFIGLSTINFKQLQQHSICIANYLLTLNNCAKVAIMLPNILAFPISLFGIWRANKTAVLINPLQSQDELLAQLNDAQVSVIITCDFFNKNLKKIITKTDIKYIIDTKISDLSTRVNKFVIDTVASLKMRHYHIKEANIKQISFMDIIKLNNDKMSHIIYDNTTALLQYTGGTTGGIKAAILSHKNLLTNTEQLGYWINDNPVGKNFLTALPLYHIFSLTVNCLTGIKLAMTNILVLNPRDIKQLVAPIKKYDIHFITGVNTLYDKILHYKNFNNLNFKHLEASISGGMAMQETTATQWQEKTGCVIIQGYGLSETSPVIAVESYHSKVFSGSVGYPMLNTQIKIVNPKKDDNARIIGEVAVKGEQVTKSYWQHPELNASSWTADGYFLTGDLGYLDNKGRLFLIDRLKEMIIVSGFNVYPSDVEKLLLAHKNIIECAVIGVDDTKHGQVVVAFVATNNKHLTATSVIDYAKEHLSHYKAPTKVYFLDELPKSPVGKVLKKDLKVPNS